MIVYFIFIQLLFCVGIVLLGNVQCASTTDLLLRRMQRDVVDKYLSSCTNQTPGAYSLYAVDGAKGKEKCNQQYVSYEFLNDIHKFHFNNVMQLCEMLLQC